MSTHVPGFQSFSGYHFILTKLATSSIIKGLKALFCTFFILSLTNGKYRYTHVTESKSNLIMSNIQNG